jgi:chemotaxis protein MotA
MSSTTGPRSTKVMPSCVRAAGATAAKTKAISPYRQNRPGHFVNFFKKTSLCQALGTTLADSMPNPVERRSIVMDIASLVGLLGTFAMIAGAMIVGGGLAPFVDVPSILIVIGGTFFAAMYTTPLPTFLGSFGTMAKAFLPPVKKQNVMIERMVELAGIARKDGMMALEGQEVPDKFFEKGMQLLVDGADETKLVQQLSQEIKAMKLRHENNQNVIKAWVDLAPAMGMIGTLIGLVLMLGNMDDPKAIGPAMAVALLTTMYGAIVANVIFAPMLTKLEGYTVYEVTYREMIVLGLKNIARGESPRNIQDQMISNLPPKMQAKMEAA